MKYIPLEHHTRMTEWLVEHRDAALLCSPGLGKTGATLTAISELILGGAMIGALIIAPLRVCSITWPNEVQKWDHLRWMRVANMRTEEGIEAWKNGTADIYLINSEQLNSMTITPKCKICKGKGCEFCGEGFDESRRQMGFVEKYIKGNKRIPADLLVIDELSLAKAHDSKRFKTLRNFLFDIKSKGKVKYRSPFTRRWGLTGTPAPNSYMDLFGQVMMLDNGQRLGSFITHFRKEYFESDYMGFKYELRPGAKEQIDKKLSDLALVMLGEDWLDLPTCNTEHVEVDLPAHAAKAYKTLEKEMLVQLETGEIEALSAAALTTKLLQITAGCVFDSEKETHIIHDAKIDALKKIRKKHPKEPLLVLTSYIHERKRILEAFPEAKQFNEKDLPLWQKKKIPMWVADARSLSHGIDGIQRGGRIAVWMTPSYSWETDCQTNARLVRTGQSAETIIYRVLAKNTIDWAVVETLRTKEEGNRGLMTAIRALQQLRKTA